MRYFSFSTKSLHFQKSMYLTYRLKPKLTRKPILDFSHPMRTRMRTFSNSKPLTFADVFKNSVVESRKEAELETAVIEKPKRRFKVSQGNPTPFGATARDGGVNFCIFSSNAVSATLCLITLSDLQEGRVTEEIFLDPFINKTGDVWHVFVKGDFKDMLYGYKFDGKFSPERGQYYDSSKIVLDLYKLVVISRGQFGVPAPNDICWPQMVCMVPNSEDEFDWEGDLLLKHSQRDLVIYEIHVRGFMRHGFMRHESSRTEFPGTYLGVVEKLDHLKDLGVNCIELMPCHEFNEMEYFSYNYFLGDYKYDFSPFYLESVFALYKI
ncbi:hypothetical protein Pint_13943 [Pistacia integerrima]|uniref:Uncharacterized protein n=1 Tax=Pistacia integerrima TaxID=434235 RepID=A0ACC0Y665_9ROSI|nr:hypothetical protein Pint_13943 [Pistacia integerrima]